MATQPRRRRKQVAGQRGGTPAPDRWHSLYAVLACGVIIFGTDGAILDANAAAQEILGTSLAAMQGHALAHVVATVLRDDGAELPPADLPSYVALRTGLPQRDIIVGITRHDGQLRWLQVDAVPLPGDDGAPTEVVSSFIDITPRKRMEEALRASEARKGAILETALDAIITVTHEGRISEFNPAAEQLFGYSRAEALGQEVARLIVPATRRAHHTRTFQRQVATGQTTVIGQKVEGWAVRRDGSEFPVEVATTRVPGANPPVFIGFIRDMSAQKQAEEMLRQQAEALRQQALHDALTGLPNRILFHDRLPQALLTMKRELHPLALLLLDLDRFKEVNDTLGHHYGDLLLREVGARIQRVVRASDTVARLGGDEFGVLLPGTDAAGAVHVAQAILTALAAPAALEGHPVTVGLSIGIGLAPDHAQDAETLLRYADSAMYAAKHAGGGYRAYVAQQDPP